MRKIILIVTVFVTELFTPSFTQAQGTLYVSNLDQTPISSAAIASDMWVAQRIITGNNPGGYTLNSIQLLMNPASGNPADFSVSIYSSSFNDVPNNDLGSLSGPVPSAGGIFTYTASNLDLSSSTPYFVVLTASTPAAQGAYDWSAVNGLVYVGNQQWTIGATFANSPDGSNWTEHSREADFQLAINATAAPEPGTLGLVGLGAAIFGILRRRSLK